MTIAPTRICILLVGQKESELVDGEKLALLNAFPDTEIRYEESHPATSMEHLRNCRSVKPDAVLLPLGRITSGIDSLAKESYRHIVILGKEVADATSIKPIDAPVQR